MKKFVLTVVVLLAATAWTVPAFAMTETEMMGAIQRHTLDCSIACQKWSTLYISDDLRLALGNYVRSRCRNCNAGMPHPPTSRYR
jgi:hypothetical protein